MNRQDFGFIEKVLPVLLSTGIVFGIVLLSGYFMALFHDKEAMNQVARAYLLKMETLGHLPVEDLEELRDSLEGCGLEEIDFSGTSIDVVSYGAPIYLVITGKVKREIRVGIPFLLQKEKALEIPIKMRLVSMAKHG